MMYSGGGLAIRHPALVAQRTEPRSSPPAKIAPVVQWTEQGRSKPLMWVRFLPGASHAKVDGIFSHNIMEKFKTSGEKNPDDMPVSREELEKALGITGVSMTRGELNAHQEKERRAAAYREGKNPDAIQELEHAMAGLTPEESKKAEEAHMRNREMGK